MMQNMRLVIWDLDEIFWKGPLLEGGIEYQQAIHDCVIESERRGVVRRICSRNVYEKTKIVLEQCGI